jgi:antitoxin (DNA-binding transcriptional repressor) of toxin-antitoxin stability system
MSGTPEDDRDAEDDRDRLPAKVERATAAGRPASRAMATRQASGRQTPVIGIRELRQHASVYVDLAERGYTVDITNRGRLVAQMVPVRDPDSPLERWIAKGVIERAEDEGSVLEIEPYTGGTSEISASEALGQLRAGEDVGGEGTGSQ